MHFNTQNSNATNTTLFNIIDELCTAKHNIGVKA